jgi:hypothetical protein
MDHITNNIKVVTPQREDGTESVTQEFFGIARFNMEDGTGRAIVISIWYHDITKLNVYGIHTKRAYLFTL